jgi:hypothetical protein
LILEPFNITLFPKKIVDNNDKDGRKRDIMLDRTQISQNLILSHMKLDFRKEY